MRTLLLGTETLTLCRLPVSFFLRPLFFYPMKSITDARAKPLKSFPAQRRDAPQRNKNAVWNMHVERLKRKLTAARLVQPLFNILRADRPALCPLGTCT